MSYEFAVGSLQTEYMVHPLGLDIPRPRFSWKLECLDPARTGLRQTACRICVGTVPGASDLWDSGIRKTDCSWGIRYGGNPLAPKTRYYVHVTVWDEKDASASAADWFETGFLNPSQEAWGGAQWIGTPEKNLAAGTMGVFSLSGAFSLTPGSSRAGIVFGANDSRLADSRYNSFGLSGNSEIRYVIHAQPDPAMVEIYRIGYAPGDSDEVPFAVFPAVCLDDGAPVIFGKNRWQPHTLRIEVSGNCAYTYIDDRLVDAVERDFFGMTTRAPRQLNPLGFNDTTTFPRLCGIGYYAGKDSTAVFSGLTVRNLRAPRNIVAQLEGVTLTGESKYLRDPSVHSLPMLRRDFTLEQGKTLASARLYIAARGIYDCRINGQPITDTWFDPGHTQYNKRINYQTYDVTGLLRSGQNGIGITLASGWWSDSQTYDLSNYNYYGDRESVLARLELCYADGTCSAFVTTPAEWNCCPEGPYTYAGFFQGEHLDGRRIREYEDLSLPGYTAPCQVAPVVIRPEPIPEKVNDPVGFGDVWPALDHSAPQLVGGYHAPVREVCRLTAKSMTQPREKLYIYDLGQEIAGVPRIRLKGKPGTQVILRFGEMLFPDLPEYAGLSGTLLTENYRDAESIDRYILRGDPEGEIYCPRFTFHGFRYIEITGVDVPPELEDVTAIQLSSVSRLTGALKTSDPLVNRLIENVRWSQLCNFISIPTDCPQRNERMGWAGDAHAFCRTATYQSDCRLFYRRYLEALRDLQRHDGKLPAIAPGGGGFGGVTYQVAMIFIAWELYQQYGDLDVVEEFYPSMKKWMTYAAGMGLPGEGFAMSLPDWLAQEETDPHLMFNAFYGQAARLMEKLAAALGHTEDAAGYRAAYKATRAYWQKTFIDPETGKTRGLDGRICDTQTSYALGILYRMFADADIPEACAHLNRRTLETGCRVFTGFFGTGPLNPALSAGGYDDTACKLLRQTEFPSWLYPVTQGATTIWERWDSYTMDKGFGGNNNMNSFNHYSLGSVLSWIYERLLGIRRQEDHPGYHRFTLSPVFCGFDFAHGGIETPFGRIESGWTSTSKGVRYECTIPPNTTADLVLPNGTVHTLEPGSYRFDL